MNIVEDDAEEIEAGRFRSRYRSRAMAFTIPHVETTRRCRETPIAWWHSDPDNPPAKSQSETSTTIVAGQVVQVRRPFGERMTTQEHSHSIVVGDSALVHIKRWNLSAAPTSYELWYAYAAGHNPALNRAVGRILAREGTLSSGERAG